MSQDPCKIPILKHAQEAKTEGIQLKDSIPICVIVVGMAGSGKTTFMTALQRSFNDNEQQRRRGYCVNLDPATKLVPYSASIDIRDVVDYQQVMKQHNLGPNGAIMTSLNLFTTKFDQVIHILEQRAFIVQPPDAGTTNLKKDQGNDGSSSTTSSTTATTPLLQQKKALDYILIDTPGQIEAFTWSASGSIVTEALATSFPTILAYVVDTPRCVNSLNTFMSNMLYACSMMYRSRLPLVVVFNKCDVVGSEVCMEWMSDYEKFQEAMDTFITSSRDGYYASLTRSLSLVLDEFYTNLRRVGVSAVTGFGINEFWDVVRMSCDDYEDDYVEDLKLRVHEQRTKQDALARINMNRLRLDLENDDNEGEREEES